MDAVTPSATGTGSYGLYWLLVTDASTCAGVCPTSAATLPTMDGFCTTSARDSRISSWGTFDTSTVSLRSTISPRGDGTLTTRTSLRVTAAA